MNLRGKLADVSVPPGCTIRDVMVCIDRNAKGVALVIDDERRLVNLITDGDARRAILAGVDLDSPVEQLLAQKAAIAQRERLRRPSPLTATVGTPEPELLRLMHEHHVSHLPLLDEAGHVVDVVFLSDLVKPRELHVRAVVMAGGMGVRLRPLTNTVPKPMLPVSGQPLLERIIGQLRQAGIRRLSVATCYLKEAIEQHFGSGQSFGMAINYLREDEPFGTAGALGLLDAWDEPLLVINGDILTRVDFGAMLDFHREHAAVMTVGVTQYDFDVPYGIVDTEGHEVRRIAEKPHFRHFINAGIYLLGPGVRPYIRPGERCEMPDLINRLLADRLHVVSFPIFEYWLDIGHLEDYERGQRDAQSWPP